MQHDQSFGSFADASASLGAMPGGHEDHFWLPNADPSAEFWDLPQDMSLGLGMEMDFGSATAPVFPTSTPSHRHSASFDWNQDIPLFQDAQPIPTAPSNQLTSPNPGITSPNQSKAAPPRRQRALAPKPPPSEQASFSSANAAAVSGNGLQPAVNFSGDTGALSSRPGTAASLDLNFGMPDTSGAHMSQPSLPANGARRSNNTKKVQPPNVPDRTFSSSPIKSTNGRPKLARTMSENRGKRPAARAPAPHQPPTGARVGNNDPIPRPSGRMSPLKRKHRLSALASIPESASKAGARPKVQFIIDSKGHARAEYTKPELGLTLSQSAINLPHRRESDDSDESSDDDDPIIIPSRNTSFNASFALPDPRKPVGSIFHSTQRSVSDRSTSAEAVRTPLDFESESEAATHETQGGGNAASELLKVVGNRQKRSFNKSSLTHHYNPLISPTSLGAPGFDTDGQEVRCVCNRNAANPEDGFMIQW